MHDHDDGRGGDAERLGTTAVTFPSNHGGFLGGESRPDRRFRRLRGHPPPRPRRRLRRTQRMRSTTTTFVSVDGRPEFGEVELG